jgi:serine/threonine-protein kinase
MATVDLLHDRTLRRKTAMKLLLPDLESDVQAVKAFIREAQVTGQLDHPNVVPVHDMGTTEDEGYFFTMKLLDGRTLADVVAELPDGPLPREQLLDLLEVVLKICDALAFAHQRGVTHRDIKPQNVMIGDFGQVYLVDWGLARLSERTGENALPEPDAVTSSFRKIWGDRVIGTPAFMSPEQARGGEVDERADIFAVGAILYFLLARQPLYCGSSPEELLEQARSCEPRPLEDVMRHGSAPRELDRIIRRALSPSLEGRYQGIIELRHDLLTFMRGGSLPQVHFAKGDLIIQEGNVGDHAYIIVMGRCEVFKTTAEGERTPIRTIGRGDCFGETAIMTAAPRTASVEALEDVTVERVTREELLEELDAMKPWVSVFLRSLAERFQQRETAGG